MAIRNTEKLDPRGVQLVDENGDAITSSNPLPVTPAAGIATDAWLHDGTGTAITSTVNGGDTGIDANIITDSIEQTTGASHNDLNLAIAGKDGSGNVQPPLLDASTRRFSVDVNSSALPSGAATAANQTTGNTSLATIAGDTTSLDGKVTAVDTNNVQQVEHPYNMEYEDGATAYQGWAEPGTATSAASWRIRRIVTTGADVSTKWADGNSNFDNIWDNRAALSYS